MNPHPSRRTIAIRQTIAVLVCLFAAACVEALHVAASTGYEAQQQRCIDQYARRADIDRCRDRVKAAWAPSDAGSDAEVGAR